MQMYFSHVPAGMTFARLDPKSDYKLPMDEVWRKLPNGLAVCEKACEAGNNTVGEELHFGCSVTVFVLGSGWREAHMAEVYLLMGLRGVVVYYREEISPRTSHTYSFSNYYYCGYCIAVSIDIKMDSRNNQKLRYVDPAFLAATC